MATDVFIETEGVKRGAEGSVEGGRSALPVRKRRHRLHMHTSKHMRCICPSGPGAVAQVCLISCLGDAAFVSFLIHSLVFYTSLQNLTGAGPEPTS